MEGPLRFSVLAQIETASSLAAHALHTVCSLRQVQWLPPIACTELSLLSHPLGLVHVFSRALC